jgi:hypothetical protein
MQCSDFLITFIISQLNYVNFTKVRVYLENLDKIKGEEQMKTMINAQDAAGCTPLQRLKI